MEKPKRFVQKDIRRFFQWIDLGPVKRMSWKRNIAVVIVVIILVLASTLFFFTRRTETEPARTSKDFPMPYIVTPRPNDRSPSYPVLISGDSVLVRALEMNRSEDVVWTRFEYNNGAQWRLIGVDKDPLDDVNRSALKGTGLFGGFLGWEADWDTSGLSDGNYSLRATMKNRAGNTGSLEMKVSFERTPPTPRLEARQGQVVRGNWTFNVSTADQDAQLMILQYWDGSNSSHDQGPGVGTMRQNDVGPNRDNGDGSTTNMFCAPTAAANGLMRLGQKDARILNGKDANGNDWTVFINKNIEHYVAKFPDDPKDTLDAHDQVKSFYGNQTKFSGPYIKDGKLTNLGLSMVLACKMRTDIDNGTAYGNIRAGLDDFLREQGIDGNYTVSGWDFDTAQASGTSNGSAWANLTKVIRENETVIINIFHGDANGTTVHSLTAKDFKVREGQRGPARKWISVVDPQGGSMDLPFIEDKDGNGAVVYNGLGFYIMNITSVSPDDSTRNRYYAAAFLPVKPVNFDDKGRDGWAVAWATTTVNDGFYLVRATLVDDRVNLGRDTVEVLVDNHVPNVTMEAQIQQGTVFISAFETTGSEDVEFMTFSYSKDGRNWTVIATDDDGSDGWGIQWDARELSAGNYLVRAATTDYAGNDGFAVKTVTAQGR